MIDWIKAPCKLLVEIQDVDAYNIGMLKVKVKVVTSYSGIHKMRDVLALFVPCWRIQELAKACGFLEDTTGSHVIIEAHNVIIKKTTFLLGVISQRLLF